MLRNRPCGGASKSYDVTFSERLSRSRFDGALMSGSSSANTAACQTQSGRLRRRMGSRMTNFAHPGAEAVKLVSRSVFRIAIRRSQDARRAKRITELGASAWPRRSQGDSSPDDGL